MSETQLAPRKRFRLPSGMALVNLLLGGWTALMFLFLYIPIAVVVVASFNDSVMNNKWEGATLRWYKGFYQQVNHGEAPALREEASASVRRDAGRISGSVKNIVGSLTNSLVIAVVTTALATILGTVSAWLLFRYRYPLSRFLNTLVAVPMIVPEIIMGISFLMLFSTLFKTLDPLMLRLGFKESPLGLGYVTVIISHVTFCFPFVMITVQARLAGLDPSLEEAAMDLGATPVQAFWKVIVPFLMPAIVSGALMAFTLSLDELIVTYFVASADSRTFPLEMLAGVKRPNPMFFVVSTLLIALTAVFVVASELMKRKNAR